MSKFNKKSKVAIAITAALSVSSFYTFAQQAEPEEKSLEVIEVKAQRRVENLQEVPVAVTAISARELERKNVSDVYQMTLNAPSLQIGENNTMSIRGAGTLAFQSTLDSSVAMALDEINLGRRFLMGPIFNDIEQIEVLSGPQGLLFGKNASAGLINIRTTKPQLDYVEGMVDVEHQLRDKTPHNSSSTITRGVLNLPTSDTSALRINAHHANQDPVAKVIATGDNNTKLDEVTTNSGLKLKYLNNISEKLSIYLIGDVNRETGVAGNFDRTYRSLGPGSGKQQYLDRDGVVAGPENFEYGADGDNYRTVNLSGFQGSIDYKLNDVYNLSFISGWRSFDVDQNLDSDGTTANELNINKNVSDYEQLTNELRLSFDIEKMVGQIGLYNFRSTINQDLFMAGNGLQSDARLPGMPFCVSDTITPPCSYRNDYFIGSDIVYAMDTNSSAIFGQFDYNFTEHFKVTSGLRYTYDDISIDLENFQRYRYFINIGAPALRNEDKSSNNVSGKVALQYITDNKDLGYLSYSRGYKGPGFADTPAPTQDDIFIRPEIVSNYEAGVKTNWLRNRLIANASVFLQKFDDYQVNSFDPSIGQNTIRNAAKVTSKGLEFGLTAMLTDDLTLNTSAMLLDSEFDSFPGAACYPNQPTCTENGTFDAQGLTPPTAAKLTNTTSFTYSFDVMEMGYGFATLSYYHRSPVNYLVNEAPMTRIGNVDQFAINVGINFESGWEVTLFCKNCNNDVVPTAVALDGGDSSIYGTATTVQVWGFNSVRNIGLKVGYHF